MTNLPAALPDECDSFSQIETVWPRTLDEYERVRFPISFISISPLCGYFQQDRPRLLVLSLCLVLFVHLFGL